MAANTSGSAPDTLHAVCPHCNAVNRLPAARREQEPQCGSCGEPLFPGKPVELGAANFERFTSRNDLPVVIDFWAEWCGPCKMIAPILDEIAADYAGRVVVAKMNVDDNPKTPMKFNVRGIPTLILFKNGQAEGQKIGAVRKPDVAAFLDGKL